MKTLSLKRSAHSVHLASPTCCEGSLRTRAPAATVRSMMCAEQDFQSCSLYRLHRLMSCCCCCLPGVQDCYTSRGQADHYYNVLSLPKNTLPRNEKYLQCFRNREHKNKREFAGGQIPPPPPGKKKKVPFRGVSLPSSGKQLCAFRPVMSQITIYYMGNFQ